MIKTKKLMGAAALALTTALSTTTLAVVTTASAQNFTTGSLRGSVVDEGGAVISGATVTVTNQANGLSRSSSTSGGGQFSITALPSGRYDVTVAAPGFNTFEGTAVVTANAASGIEFSLVSENSDVVTVTGTARSLVDFSSPETGFNVNVDEIADNIPVSRDIGSVALLAPQTALGDSAFQDSTKPNLVQISGSSVGENAFYINGFNITDFRNFLGTSNIPFEFYEDLSVKTGGLSAEFGRFTGGVIAATTKSGSNEFKFGGNLFWQPDSLQAEYNSTELADGSFRVFNKEDDVDTFEGNIYVSGPIIKDKLFFYGIYNERSQTISNSSVNGSSTTNGTFSETKLEDPFYAANVDFYLTDTQQFELTYINNEQTAITDTFAYTIDGGVGSQSGVSETFAGGENWIFNYNGAWTDWLSLSATYGNQTIAQTAASSTAGLPAIYDSREGGLIPLGTWNPSALVVEAGDDERTAYRIDADILVNDFLGDHSIRIGWDREELSSTNQSQYSGGIYYRYFAEASGTCQRFVDDGLDGDCARVRELDSGGSFETTQSAFYVQDQWTVSDQITLNLGVRVESFENLDANGNVFAEIENTIAPRLGVVFDPFGEGRERLYANWGRYYLPIANNTNIRLAGAEFFTQTFYNLDGLNADDTPILGDFLGQDVFGTGDIPDPRTVIDTGLDPFFVDEALVGYERFVGDNWRVNGRFVHRTLGGLIEDAAVDAGMIRYCEANGFDVAACEDVWGGFHSYVLVNPGQEVTWFTDELPGLEGTFTEVTLSPEQLGLPAGKRKSNSFTFEFERKFDGMWGLQGSYTLSKVEGNYEGTVKSDNGQDDAGITQDFDNEGLTDNSFGELPTSNTHVFKLFGTYVPVENVVTGASLIVQSPRKYGCIGVHPTDNIASQYGASSWFCDFDTSDGPLESVATPRGTLEENDWLSQLDLFASFRPESDLGQFEFRVDVFNVFDQDAVTDIDEFEPGSATRLDTYGAATGYQRPRYVRFSVGYDF